MDLRRDSNSSYYHGIAIGRKSKTTILTLEDERAEITDKEELKAHIYSFYKSLFGSPTPPRIHFSQNLWRENGRVDEQDNLELIKDFTLEEIESALKETKTNTASGPDGFSVTFYKAFWPQIKDQIK